VRGCGSLKEARAAQEFGSNINKHMIFIDLFLFCLKLIQQTCSELDAYLF
jgi:hypothetical protein